MPGFLASFGGSLLSGGLSALGAGMQQSSSRSMAREQMRFQERMSSTAYQRAAKDLEAAGLNRILAVGSPASSPGGAMGRAENILATGAGSAMQAKRLQQDLDNLRATEADTRAATRVKNAEAMNTQVRTAMTAAQLRLLSQVPTQLSNLATPWLNSLLSFQGDDPVGSLRNRFEGFKANLFNDLPGVSSARSFFNNIRSGPGRAATGIKNVLEGLMNSARDLHRNWYGRPSDVLRPVRPRRFQRRTVKRIVRR